MQIKNEYVTIKNGKTYDFRNTITNDYLKLFNKSQYDDNYKKMSSTDKELIYCYIKTDEEISQDDTTYYNLVDIETADSSGSTNYFTIDNNYWLNYNRTGRFINDDINFNNSGYIELGQDYNLLFAIKNINVADGFNIYINNNIYFDYNPNNNVLKAYLDDNEMTITKKNNVYYCSFHLHNIDSIENLISLDVSGYSADSSGLSFSLQYSIIKENNNNNYIEQPTNYQYSKYIDLTDLAGQYNYRIPIMDKNVEGKNNVEVYYTYNNVSGYSKTDGSAFNDIVDINDMADQTIKQLAFGNNNIIYAFVDVSAGNIKMQENEVLYVYRKDSFSSDAYYTGNYYPAHLSPLGVKIDDYIYYGSLYSVGFGFSKGNIHEEYLISENPVTEIDDYTFQIELERGTSDTLTPNNNLYPNSNLYPVLEVHTTGIYPNNNLYPSTNIYPQLTDYKYIIYKFNLYRISNNTIIYLNEFYTMSFYTEKKGTVRANTKLERS